MANEGTATGTIRIATDKFKPFRHTTQEVEKSFDLDGVCDRLRDVFDEVNEEAAEGEIVFSFGSYDKVFIRDADLDFLQKLAQVGFTGSLNVLMQNSDTREIFSLRDQKLFKTSAIEIHSTCFGTIDHDQSDSERTITDAIDAIKRHVGSWQPSSHDLTEARREFARLLSAAVVETLDMKVIP